MNDLISRQAAIDAAKQHWYKPDIAKALEELPSAQPDLDSAYTEGYTQAEAKYRKMWDEMQANIKEKAFGKRGGLIHTADIDAMPTIEPERKTGKWICSDDLYETAICPLCVWDTTEPYGHIRSWFRYCPRCGARLVHEGEDNDS